MANWITKRFVTSLNQPGNHPNGKHRRPSPQAHGNPSHGAGAGAGGALPLSPRTISLKDISLDLAFFNPSEPAPPTIPYAGIRTGEIIGERFWWIKRHGLTSLSTEFTWKPGATVSGDTNKEVQRWVERFFNEVHVLYGGVYSFLPAHPQLLTEMAMMEDTLNRYSHNIFQDTSFPIGFAHGTIKMWGDVVEHEHGFRAQFAKLLYIDSWHPNPDDPWCAKECESIVQSYNKVADAQTTLPRT